ncbi:MAG: hypothetical protein NVV73_05480 [Cellvibrionaceae bacterium]|nr:hypothetical protein [Cellvibrionaceae bacterium]
MPLHCEQTAPDELELLEELLLELLLKPLELLLDELPELESVSSEPPQADKPRTKRNTAGKSKFTRGTYVALIMERPVFQIIKRL